MTEHKYLGTDFPNKPKPSQNLIEINITKTSLKIQPRILVPRNVGGN